MLSLPRLPKTIGQATGSVLATAVSPATRARLARRLAAQVRRRRADVAPLTPLTPAVPAVQTLAELPPQPANAEAVAVGFACLRALRKRGWLGEIDAASITDGPRLFAAIAAAIQAQVTRHCQSVQECLPPELLSEQALCLTFDGLQALHASLCSGAPLSSRENLWRVSVEACNAFVLELTHQTTDADRVARGAWDALAKAMKYERLVGSGDSLAMCHPMLDELLRDALVHSRLVDGKRVLDQHLIESFEGELGWDTSDPEQLSALCDKINDYAAHVASASARAPISPASDQGRAWLASAPPAQAARVKSLMELAKLVRRFPPVEVESEREGMFAGCVAIMEIIPGFESEADEFLQTLGSEPEIEACQFGSLDQLLDALPRVIVTTAAANAAMTLMLEHARDE